MNTSPVLDPISPVDAPVQPANPMVAPLPELEEVAQAIIGDCVVTPADYLKEIRVTGGGE